MGEIRLKTTREEGLDDEDGDEEFTLVIREELCEEATRVGARPSHGGPVCSSMWKIYGVKKIEFSLMEMFFFPFSGLGDAGFCNSFMHIFWHYMI